MQTIQYEVAYKTAPNTPKYTHPFHSEQAATAFMYNIEINGGISVMQRVVKDEPLRNSGFLGEDNGTL